MKLIFKLVAVLLLLVVVGLVAGFFYANHLVKAGVEHAGEYALGVQTDLDSADVALFDGKCNFHGLTVYNPVGDWDADHFFAMDDLGVAVTLGSLRSQTVEVPTISLKGIDMFLERKGDSSNYKPILDHLKQFESTDEETKQEESSGKKFIIKELMIEDVTVTADLLPLGGKLSRTVVKIPRIRLTDVGSDSDRGVLLAEVTDIVMKAILEAVLDQGVKLPGNIAGELQAQLARLEDIENLVGGVTAQLGEVTQQATRALEEAGKSIEGVQEGLDKAGEDVKKGVEGLKEGIGGLLNGEKNKDE